MDGGIEVILGELIEMVQATAPMLWAIAQRQVLANTVVNAVWGALLFVIAAYCANRARRDPDEDTVTFCAFMAVLALLVALICITTVIMYAVSPDYYAIKVLLELVR